jgi:AcrR family transcriptional regulator
MSPREHAVKHGEGRAAPRAARPSGRRPGESGTREAILAAARHEFAESGFDHATIRGIAARARVDPALVHHYFGSKDRLFEAALELPISAADVLPTVLGSADRRQIGETITRRFLSVWEDPANRPVFMAMLRSVVGDEHAADLVRERLGRQVFGPIAGILGVADAGLRANLVGSQFIGLALARYVGRVEPLASADIDTVVTAVGPTIQRYLTGDITGIANGPA